MLRSPLEVQLDYLRDGFVFPIPVLTAEAAAATARLVDDLAPEDAPAVRLPSTHRYFRWAYDLAAQPRLLDVVERLLGPDILVWGTLVLAKAAGSRAIVSWHQDSAYSWEFLNGSPAASAWIALTPATRESGCMRVIPGSHGRRLPFTTEQPPDDMLKRGLRVTSEIDEAAAVDMELQPGEASLHEISLVHGSNANLSRTPRTGFIVRYATPVLRHPGYPIYCVRGNPGIVPCISPPAPGESAESRAAYLEYLHAREDSVPGGN